MPDGALLREKDGHVLIVTINRPEKKNAVDAEVLCGLSDAWHQLDEDDDLRVAILTGAGTDFCAGMDLGVVKKLTTGAPPENAFDERIAENVNIIFDGWLKTYRPTKPVICAVEGYALAGGTVQIAGGLVGNQHRGIEQERSRDRDALLFAAGHLTRAVAHAILEPEVA